MRSGELYLLRAWEVADSGTALRGSGVRYSIARQPQDSGPHLLPIDSIALLETETRAAAFPFGLQALAVMTTIYGSLSVICLADPKSCFGSCPTFYLEDRSREMPQAEGFSASVARVLEERDVDALVRARPAGSRFAIRMRNEALETHAVRRLRLLAVRRPAGGRVFQSADGRFYPAGHVLPPTACRAAEGDCRAAVLAIDSLERSVPADSTDLAARETIELEFPAAPGSRGVVLGARHTLLTTFLFYQTMAYMGRRAGEWLATLERGTAETAAQAFGMAQLLGGVDVEVAEGGGPWRAIGSFREAGPIAGDVQVFPYEARHPHAPLHVRLRMAKGNWRLGYVALANLRDPIVPTVLEPARVERRGRPDAAALAALRDSAGYLITYPGDEYRVVFGLPRPAEGLELFLESQGYYYEWMRAEWLKEEDPALVGLIIGNPAEGLRRLAGPHKAHEPAMERAFWESRFGTRR
ncbi:MAG: hypothetical protein HYS40_01665 [Gemmatimonadetes bacterium]|nr:hypothetical protein [Gemmatimonadota bacterium]